MRGKTMCEGMGPHSGDACPTRNPSGSFSWSVTTKLSNGQVQSSEPKLETWGLP